MKQTRQQKLVESHVIVLIVILSLFITISTGFYYSKDANTIFVFSLYFLVISLLSIIICLSFYSQKNIYKARMLDDSNSRLMLALKDAQVDTLQHLTEQKKLEEQLQQAQKMEAIGHLAGGVAHDFNNLLTVINGCSLMLMDDIEKTSPLFKNLQNISKAGSQAESLTRQLLAFSRKQVLAPRVLNLNELIRTSQGMLQRLIGEDIGLKTYFEKDLSYVKADPGQIEQIILNLAVNARYAMPTGGELIIETQNVYLDEEYTKYHPGSRPGHYVVFSIADNGSGMDEKVQERIFEPFFTTRKTGDGTGLGLSTVYGIIKQSKGTIRVYSEIGIGTTFKIYLPVNSKPIKVWKTMPQATNSLCGDETILIAEDKDMVRQFAINSLEKFGYHLISANDGYSALKKAEKYKKNIHLLLTDVVMPNMSGKELSEKVKAIYPGTKIIFMSGYTDNTIVHHGILDNKINFIQKPFSQNSLAKIVRETLDTDSIDSPKIDLPKIDFPSWIYQDKIDQESLPRHLS